MTACCMHWIYNEMVRQMSGPAGAGERVITIEKRWEKAVTDE